MALENYKKYQILLRPESKKTQGLKVGDIVRRQYVDGVDIYYSLMAVLSTGVETETLEDGKTQEQPYFIGALLSGEAPKSEQLLDFVRVTNLFNEDRNGALYLTASDSEAPYMDIIDQIGRKGSLSWPENLEAESFSDASSQYIVNGRDNFALSYSTLKDYEYKRVLSATRTTAKSDSFEGLSQQFYQFVKNPQRVLISYRVKASQEVTLGASLGYTDDFRIDASWEENVTTEWQYVFRVVSIEYSGRHLRSFKLSFENLGAGEEVQIADFNIILQSSIENFADAATMRIGKLDGVIDPVFGQLKGYGAYLQELYATNGAHVSGTLTAGDENGFGGTFYAGKIHRNVFCNSTDVSFLSGIHIDANTVANPTGMGYVYSTEEAVSMVAQSNEWLLEHHSQRYCFSIWIYAKWPCQIGVQQNGYTVGTFQIPIQRFNQWTRVSAYFDLLEPQNEGEDMIITLLPEFDDNAFAGIEGFEPSDEEQIVYISAPQLEKGEKASQYQATDSQLNYTDDYGAWFARGGIGGTIQNPLLKLNYDGEGSIGTRNGSLEFKQDGSGHLAHQNIKWDEEGKVEFGTNVTLNWDNLSKDAQEEIVGRGLDIVGEDTFMVLHESGAVDTVCSPASITLTLEETGFTSTSSMRQWYYKSHGEFVAIPDAHGSSFTILPDDEYWDNESAVVIQCVVKLNSTHEYSDIITIKKQYIQGYEVRLSSSNGQTYHNGKVSTVITASVYYQGKLVDMDYVLQNFQFQWERYLNNDFTTAVDLDAAVGPEYVLTVDHNISAAESYRCILVTGDGFTYTFPILFSDEDTNITAKTEDGVDLTTENNEYIVLG